MLNRHEFTVERDRPLREEAADFPVGRYVHHPRHFIEGNLQFDGVLNHVRTGVAASGMVFVLSDVRPCRRQVDVTAERHHHGDVAAVGHRGVKHADRHATAVGSRVGLSDDNNPFTWLNVARPLKGGSVHLSVNVNGFSLNTGHRIEHDVGVNQSVGVKLVRHEPFCEHETGDDFDVRGIRAVVDGKAGLVFGFVVHGFKPFLLDRYVVHITDGHEDTPNTLIVGHDRG